MAAGTFEITELAGRAEGLADSGAFQAGFILILIGAFGKSAQFPFHYWLPNAMSAPTPVSAYLHSATMVKLGVFLIARLLPVFHSLESWAPVLILIGFVTFLIGALFALLSHKLKAILAYSTVSQLGFLVGFYGMTPPDGAHWDLLHIANHVLYKGALFMVVGIIDHSTGIKDIRELGGLRKRLPLLFAITLICAASMAGVIGTTGFLSKEYMLKEKLDYLMDAAFLNAFPIMVVIIGSTIKVAFSLRLVMHLFFGGESKRAMAHFHRPSFLIQLPPLVLAVLTVLGGLIPWLSSRALEAFMVSGLHDLDPAPLKIWHGLDSPAFLISCGILLAGYLLFRLFDKTGWRWAVIPKWARFDDGFAWAVDRLPAFGGWISRVLGVEHPRYHAPIVLAVSLVWVGYPLIKMAPHFSLPVTTGGDLLLPVLSAALLVCAGVCLVFVNSWKAKVILMGVIGFLMTFYFILYRAPDLALTQILIEVASLLLLLLLILRFPSLRTPPEPLTTFARGINGLISVGVGVLIFTLTLVFSGRPNGAPLGEGYLAASMPLAKGSNAVNTILVDFRGFDTLMEIGVLVIATLGIMGLLLHRNRI
jgi:multisubunit Na+/H+ antiporter MnhB subunit